MPKPSAQIAQRLDMLRRALHEHDYRYYTLAQPTIADEQYDKLMRELLDLEAHYPDLYSSDSPTQRVGGAPTRVFATVTHSPPMLSLANSYSEEEIREFDRRVRGLLENQTPEYVAELKFDGVAIALKYREGAFTGGATRGDGTHGDDITQNLKTVRSLPLRLRTSDPTLMNIEVRGEVYMERKDFERLNRQQVEAGEKMFINPRNTTAGTLKLQDPKIVATRPLKVFAYALIAPDGTLSSHNQSLQKLKRLGLPVSQEARLCKNIDQVIEYWKEWEKKRDTLPYDIDGVVVKVDSLKQQEMLGNIAKSPRWAIAFKFTSRKAETKLKSITLQVGRLGTITPVAELEPVFVGGSTVGRATLNNYDYIEKLGVLIGDPVVVEKGGDVIPKITGIGKGPRGTEKFRMPSKCPTCKSPLIQPEGEINYYCDNPGCPDQVVGRLEHFASRKAMDIEQLGGSVAEKLIQSGRVQTPLDLFALNVKTLAQLNLGDESEKRVFGEKNAAKVIDAVERARTFPLSRWLYALGIPNVGDTIAHQLAKVHKNLLEVSSSDILRNISELAVKKAEADLLNPKGKKNPIGLLKKQLKMAEHAKDQGRIIALKKGIRERTETDGPKHRRLVEEIKFLQQQIKTSGLSEEVGPVVANSIIDFFNSKSGKKILRRLEDLGIFPQGLRQNGSGGGDSRLNGRVFVLTGVLTTMKREGAAEEIRKRGGSVTNSVSKNTSYLVVGKEPGSKLDNARSLGVTILNEDEFRKLLDSGKQT